MYSDQNGKFPYLSSKGMRYIMIAYLINVNYFFSNTMRNITESQMLQTYDKIIMWTKMVGLETKNHVLDNEIKQLVHETPQKLQDQPNPHAPPNYGSKVQHAKAIDNFRPL